MVRSGLEARIRALEHVARAGDLPLLGGGWFTPRGSGLAILRRKLQGALTEEDRVELGLFARVAPGRDGVSGLCLALGGLVA